MTPMTFPVGYHDVLLAQWYDQMRMVGNARSITARLFIRSEFAQNHCQVGNYGLALRTIVNWLDETPLGDACLHPPLPSGRGV